MSDLETIWRRIEQALANLDPPEDPLPPGATDADLDELEQRLGRPLPDELRDSLRLHDGTGDTWLGDDMPELLSVEQMGDEYEMLATIGFPGAEGSVRFEPHWIPVMSFAGLWTLLDASETGGERQLLVFSAEETEVVEREDYEASLTSWLREAADRLEALAPTEPAKPTAAPWSIELIDRLIASGDLELVDDESKTSLADRLDRAAEKVAARSESRPGVRSGARALAEELLEVFISAPEVEEIYTDRDGILKAAGHTNE